MIKEVGVTVGRAVADRAGRIWSRFHEASPLSADVLEADDSYLVVFDAPGVAHSDVQVRYVDGEVLVRIDRFRDFREGFEMVFPGRGMSLDGRMALPDGAVVEPEAAEAHLRPNGTLEVWVPKEDPDENEPGVEERAHEGEPEDEGADGAEAGAEDAEADSGAAEDAPDGGENAADEAIEAGR